MSESIPMKNPIVLYVFSFLVSSSNFAFADSFTESEKIYKDVCSVCHGISGTGELPGVPDFTKPDGRLSKKDDVLVNNILNGYKSEGSPMAMPPGGGMSNMSHTQAKDMVKYLKSIF